MKTIFATALTLVAGAAIANTAVAESPASSLKDLISYVDNNPNDVDTLIRLGSMLNNQGLEAEAAVYLDRARELDPSVGDLSDAGVVYQTDDVMVRGASEGQDVWVCTMPGVSSWGLDEGYYAYSVATTSANQGDEILNWIANPSNLHPVIGQNLFQYHNGLFRQVGQSWLKHGFCALQNGGCGSCMPAGSGCPPRLGPGCSDPYGSGLNGTQFRLGPKHEVNPTTGIFPGSHSTPTGTNNNRGRLLVPQELAIPSSSGAQYWVEGQYIHAEDSHTSSDNSLNNVSHATTSMSSNSVRSLSTPPTFLTAPGNFPEQPAIFAWQGVNPTVEIELIEADGYIYAAGGYEDLGGGQYRYQYNIFNLDSNAGVDGVTVNFGGTGVNVSNVGFHFPEWHSGSLYSNDAWLSAARGGDAFEWSTDGTGPNNNRIRWATTYTYWFTADSEPEMGLVTLNVPGEGQYDVMLPVPAGSACFGDLDGDGEIGSGDLGQILAAWGMSGGAADLDGSGTVGSGDLGVVLAGWGPCP